MGTTHSAFGTPLARAFSRSLNALLGSPSINDDCPRSSQALPFLSSRCSTFFASMSAARGLPSDWYLTPEATLPWLPKSPHPASAKLMHTGARTRPAARWFKIFMLVYPHDAAVDGRCHLSSVDFRKPCLSRRSYSVGRLMPNSSAT